MDLPKKQDLTMMQKFIDELDKESERGCGLLAASWLEGVVKDLLRCTMFEGAPEPLLKDVFSGSGAYSTFSACIGICYLSGQISKKEHNALNIIRKVRNECAHSENLDISFANHKISNRCKELQKIFPDLAKHLSNDPKAIFIAICSYLVISLSHMRRAQTIQPKEKQEFQWHH